MYQIPINIPLIDSLSLKIDFTKVIVQDLTLTSTSILFYPDLEQFDDVERPPEPITITRNGITVRFQIIEIPIYDKETQERVQTRFLQLTMSAKLLKHKYFEGITKHNIKDLYNEFISYNIVYFEFNDFLEGIVNDIDICFNRYTHSPKTFENILTDLQNQVVNKKHMVHITNEPNPLNLGINFNQRHHAKPSTPFIKIYFKEWELYTKSAEFYTTYLSADFGHLIKNLTRVEVTIRNHKHKTRLIKYGIYNDFKTLNDLLNVPQEHHKQFILFSFNSYLEKQTRQRAPHLSPTDHIIYELIQNCVIKGYDFESLKCIADTFQGKLSDSTDVARSRIRKKIADIFDLLVFKDAKLESIHEQNTNINNYLKFLQDETKTPFFDASYADVKQKDAQSNKKENPKHDC